MQNFLLQSESFDTASWPKLNSTVNADVVANPIDGLVTADSLVENTTSGLHHVSQGYAATNLGVYTLSVHVKAGTRNWIALQLGTGANYFNLTGNGVVGSAAGTGVLKPEIRLIANGWYKINVSFNVTTAGTYTSIIYAANADVGASYVGVNGAEALYVFGASLVNANWPADYAKTTTSIINTGRPRDIVLKQNLALWSEDFTNAAWQAVHSGDTVLGNQIIAPDGQNTGDKITFTDIGYLYQRLEVGGPARKTFTWSAWLRSPSKATIGLRVSDNLGLEPLSVTTKTITLTDSWVRHSWTANFTLVNAATAITFGLDNRVGVGGDGIAGDVYIWGGQITKSNNLGDYQPTLGTSVNNPIRNAVFKQNLLRSSDVSAVYTTKVGTPTITGGQLAPDGTLTAFNVTSANTTTYLQQQVVRNLAIGKNYVTSVWMKADANCNVGMEFIDVGDGNPAYSVTQAVTTQWQQFSISAILGATAGVGAMGLILGSRFAAWPTARTVTVWHPQIVEANWVGDDCPTSGVIIDNPIRDVVLKQNLLPYSNAFVTNWTYTAATPVANSTNSTAPDGTSTAVELKEDGGLSLHRVTTTVALAVIGKQYTFSVYLKKGTRNFAALQFDSGSRYGNVNLTTGETLPGSVSTTMTSKLLTDGWVRVDITTNLTTGGNVYIYPATGLAFADITYQGVLGDIAMYIWQAQYVRANHAGDLQPTVGTAITNPIRDIVLKQNLLIYSNQMENWTKTAGCTRTTVVEDGRTCSRLDFATNGDYIYRNSVTTVEAGPVGTALIPSFWIKKISSSGTISMFNPVSLTYGRFIIDLALLPSGWVKIDYAKPAPWMTVTHFYSIYSTRNDGMAFQPVDVGLSVFVADNQIVAKANHGGDYQPTGATAIFNPIRNIVL